MCVVVVVVVEACALRALRTPSHATHLSLPSGLHPSLPAHDPPDDRQLSVRVRCGIAGRLNHATIHPCNHPSVQGAVCVNHTPAMATALRSTCHSRCILSASILCLSVLSACLEAHTHAGMHVRLFFACGCEGRLPHSCTAVLTAACRTRSIKHVALTHAMCNRAPCCTRLSSMRACMHSQLCNRVACRAFEQCSRSIGAWWPRWPSRRAAPPPLAGPWSSDQIRGRGAGRPPP